MTPDDRGLEQEIDSLYALSPDEFTAARNELSKALRKNGDREAADRVKALKKPPVTAWAVNQVVHHRPEVFAALVEATQQIRTTHQQGPDGLNTARAAHREALAAAAQVAEVMLMGAGGRPGPAQMRRVTQTLEALSTDPGEAVPGRLEEDLEPPGFGALAGLAFGGVVSPTKPRAMKGAAGSVARRTAPKTAAKTAPTRKKTGAKTAPTRKRTGAKTAPTPKTAATNRKTAARTAVKTSGARDAQSDVRQAAARALAKAKKELRDLERVVAAAEKAMATAQRGFETAEEEQAKADNAVTAAKKELADAERSLSTAKAKLTAASTERATARQASRSARRDRVSAEKAHQKAVDAMDEARESMRELNS